MIYKTVHVVCGRPVLLATAMALLAQGSRSAAELEWLAFSDRASSTNKP